MSVRYHCPHLDRPHAPYPPCYASSSSSFSRLDSLYFCEECDAVRCDQCVATEIASYYCPNCLFDVPSANVRGDRNRCARSCFACPTCTAALQVIPTDTLDPASGQMSSGPPYLLSCPGCKWSSREIQWEFEKGTGIALQLQKMNKETEKLQNEFEAIKDHLEGYMTSSAPVQAPIRSTVGSRNPARHISHLTQMAAKALNRDVAGMRPRTRPKDLVEKAHDDWDEIREHKSKATWKVRGLEKGMSDVDDIRMMHAASIAELGKTWGHSWYRSRDLKSIQPERIPLQTKLTKRCPDGSCRHLLIQPDTKTTRFKIKMVANNYLPEVEIGRRRRRVQSVDHDQPMTPEEVERRRRERRKTRGRAEEEEEAMDEDLHPSQVYTFQLAFTNPLYDPIQIRLTQPHPPKGAPSANHHIHLPTQHFTVAPFKDAWAYDEEEEEEDGPPALESSEGVSEGGSSSKGTLGRRSRKSLLMSGSVRDKKRGELGVEKKGNTSIVGLEVEVLPGAVGPVEFDLEVRYTYRAEDMSEKEAGAAGSAAEDGGKKDEYKTFTYWVRIHAGSIVA